MPFEVAGPRLLELGFEISADFWDAVRGNLSRLDDAISFAKIIQGSVQPVIGAEDAEFVAQALAELPDGPWTQTTWSEWTSALKAKTERKGKTLFMPLRLALTGSEHGPEMQNLLPLIGEEKTRQRLSGTAG